MKKIYRYSRCQKYCPKNPIPGSTFDIYVFDGTLKRYFNQTANKSSNREPYYHNIKFRLRWD